MRKFKKISVIFELFSKKSSHLPISNKFLLITLLILEIHKHLIKIIWRTFQSLKEFVKKF